MNFDPTYRLFPDNGELMTWEEKELATSRADELINRGELIEMDSVFYYSDENFSMVPDYWILYRPEWTITELGDEDYFFSLEYEKPVCQSNFTMCMDFNEFNIDFPEE